MDPESITVLLRRIEGGEHAAKEQLIHEVYSELHGLACHYLASERAGHTLQPTALVNEIYIKIVQSVPEAKLRDKQHLLRTAAKAMRNLLIDHARGRNSLKRGGSAQRESLDHIVDYYEEQGIEITALDTALEHLGDMDPELAQIVELKFFGGRSNKETAEVLGVSERTVERSWSTGRAWLKQRLESE
ncbi:MAG: RNA polymerase sigma-70 factor (ECF subfamily) [Planctomycetota bacterium]|jgi:RNA polymerase sigma-70 factor (ECF subfamily)